MSKLLKNRSRKPRRILQQQEKQLPSNSNRKGRVSDKQTDVAANIKSKVRNSSANLTYTVITRD
jgi:hypothetical protein